MPMCECGRGKETAGGDFLPGHDQKLRSRIEKYVGGLLPLRDLVESARAYVAGHTGEEEFLRRVRELWSNARQQ